VLVQDTLPADTGVGMAITSNPARIASVRTTPHILIILLFIDF
jgi:hypothetical protein